MVQAHKGYFQEGKFVPFDAATATIPNNVEVYIVITENAVTETKTKSQRQGEALEKLLATLEATDETLTENFDEILAQGISIRGINL